MTWRKAWAKNWAEVRYCSDACRARRSQAMPDMTDSLATFPAPVRHLVIVLGDQLDRRRLGLRRLRPRARRGLDGRGGRGIDACLVEPSSASRCFWRDAALCAGAARRRAGRCTTPGWTMPATAARWPPSCRLRSTLHQPDALVMTAPGDWRVLQAPARRGQASRPAARHPRRPPFLLHRARVRRARQGPQAAAHGILLPRDAAPARGMLMDGDKPVGGQWNFDADNRESFGKAGPRPVPPRSALRARCDHARGDRAGATALRRPPRLARQLRLAGDARAGAAGAHDFIDAPPAAVRPLGGRMWPGEPWLYHSHLSAALNLKLLDRARGGRGGRGGVPRGHAPLASVEGFIRQILGWREYVRGIYWRRCPATSSATRSTRKRRCPLLLDRRHRHGLPARRDRPDPRTRLRAPHPAPDGHGPVRAAARRAAASRCTSGTSRCMSMRWNGWSCPTRWA